MARHLAAALAAILITWLAPAGDASAQACSTFPSGTGRDLFCRTTAQGGFDCDRSGCHAGASATNNVQKIHNAASWSAIIGAINGGVALMNPGAAFNGRVMTDTEAQDIAAFVASWFSAGPAAPSCTLSSSNTTPSVGTSITLTASCTGSPTSYAWTGCASTGSNCTRTETTTGSRTYSVTATNAAGASAPASMTINWQAAAGPPTPTPTPPPSPTPTPVPPPTPTPPKAVAIEYYHSSLDHYFVTSSVIEISDLDRGVHGAWSRTGVQFSVYGGSLSGINPVCRFYLPPPGNTHFYSADPAECQWVASGGAGGWQLESMDVFFVALADATTGACPSDTRPVWRFWNLRTPNHRYTPEVTIRDQLRSNPTWKADDYGKGYPVFCVPW